MMGLIVDKSSPFQFLFDDGTGTISVVDFNNKKNSPPENWRTRFNCWKTKTITKSNIYILRNSNSKPS